MLDGRPLTNNNEVDVNIVKCNSNSMFITPATEVEVVDIIKGLKDKVVVLVLVYYYIILLLLL
jgi:hypothetical protein